MYQLKVKNNNGDILQLTNNSNYEIIDIDGLNPPKVTINASVNTTTDGSKVNSVRVESRNIVIYIAIRGNAEKNRLVLYDYFPNKKEVTLYYANSSRNVYIKGIVENIDCKLFTNQQIAQISIICADPYFKNINNLTTTFSDVMPMFEFPFSIEETGKEFSVIVHNIRKNIFNQGNFETGINIKLFATGTVVKPIIYDVLQKTYIKLNFTMQPSDTIIIDTTPRNKSIELVRSGITSNILGNMSMDSTFFTLKAGDNVFSYDCESGSDNLQITFTTPILYSGV